MGVVRIVFVDVLNMVVVVPKIVNAMETVRKVLVSAVVETVEMGWALTIQTKWLAPPVWATRRRSGT